MTGAARPATVEAAAAAAAVLRRWAAAVDRESRFPAESVAALREGGLLGLVVPERYGGRGESWPAFAAVARTLGGACLSTAMVWVMHCQQAAAVVRHGEPALRAEALPAVARGDVLLAGVTSETGGDGGLLSVRSPAAWEDAHVCFEREAPVVTAGGEAGAFLLSLRRSAEAAPDDAVLVYARRDQVRAEVTAPWTALGMRGTRSVAMRLTGRVPAGQVLCASGGFRDAVVRTLVPVAHLGWSAAWLGAAGAVVQRTGGLLRRRGRGGGTPGDVTLAGLGRIRMRLDLAASLLGSVARDYQRAVDGGSAGEAALAATRFQIRLNGLKVAAAEAAHAAVDDAMGLLGVGLGYTVNEQIHVERAYRDLRAASLMFSNERLLRANGALSLVDGSIGEEFG